MYLFILILALVLSAGVVYVVYKYPHLKSIFQPIYVILILGLSVLLVINIRKPIKFNKKRQKIENATIERLKDIRTAQVAYKDKFGQFTGSFDTLISFIKNDSFDLKRIVRVKPWDQDVVSKEDALKQGILKESIIKKSVRDSLFPDENYPVDRLRFIPFTKNSPITMAAGEVMTGSQVKVKVFEAYALYDSMFKGMNKQQIINYKDERYKITNFNGDKVGSLTEATNNAGNWEK